MSFQNDEILTLSDTAKLLGVSTKTLHRWFQKREGPPRIKMGHKVYYRRSSIMNWLERLEQTPVRSLRVVS